MIQQPELGKKISDLRKAKGFTQEELVDKCNLSVRTLQRIEAGEVTPRPVTVKLIFEALDVSFDKTMKDKGLVLKWLKQFYINFIDLFNLKTNTMKKITILTVIFSSTLFCLFLASNKSNAQATYIHDKQVAEKILPTESLCDSVLYMDTLGYWFTDNDGMLASDITFKYNGTTFKFRLVKIIGISKFNAGYFQGKLLDNKVEAKCMNEHIIDGCIEYTADKIEKVGNKIFLRGNAKLTSKLNGFIKSNEIILETR